MHVVSAEGKKQSKKTNNCEILSLAEIHLWHKSTCDLLWNFAPILDVMYYFPGLVWRGDPLVGESHHQTSCRVCEQPITQPSRLKRWDNQILASTSIYTTYQQFEMSCFLVFGTAYAFFDYLFKKFRVGLPKVLMHNT